MKLMSSIEFGKIQKERLYNKEINYVNYFGLRDGYDDLLKQPLELSMFVPYDKDGNVLEEPDADYYMNVTEKELKQYQEAKEMVLFEGFYIDFETIICYKDLRIWFTEGKVYLNNTFTELTNIEDLINHCLVLTESAKKQIGL